MPVPPGPVSVSRRTDPVGEAVGDLRDLVRRPDQGGDARREVGAGAAGGDERREPRRQVRVHELEQVLGPPEVPQVVLAEVEEADAVREPLGGERPGGGRQQHLAAVPSRHDPRGAVDGGPEVVAAALLGLARSGCPSAPAAGRSRPTTRRASARCAARLAVTASSAPGKTAIIPSPVVLTMLPPRRLDGLAQDRVVPAKGDLHRVRELLPQARAALQVREQEGEGSGRRHLHAPIIGLQRRDGAAVQWCDGTRPARDVPHRRHLRLHRATSPTSSSTTPRTSSPTSSAPSSPRSGPASGWPSSRATRRSRSPSARRIDGSLLLDTIERCYFGFRRRRRDVRQATSCECNACSRIPDLDLKFVVHHGEAIHQKVAGRQELLGSDVIVVHRLLKNEVVERTGIEAYALLSQASLDAAGSRSAPPSACAAHVETYDRIGEVQGWVLDLERRWQEEEARARVFVTPGRRRSLTISVPTTRPAAGRLGVPDDARPADDAGSRG